MRPLLFPVAVLSVLISLHLAGCGERKSAEHTTTEAPATAQGSKTMMPSPEVTATPGAEAVPQETAAVPVEGLYIRPYFDDAGTHTEITVSAGDQFDLFVYGETVEGYPTNAAEFRLQLPPGVRVIGTTEHELKKMSLGQPDFNYMVAFECQQPGRFRIVTYRCMVEPDCQGGVVESLPGFLGENRTFLGFTNCEFMEVTASGGTATVKVR